LGAGLGEEADVIADAVAAGFEAAAEEEEPHGVEGSCCVPARRSAAHRFSCSGGGGCSL
jgi:hypothetical protein